MLGFLGRQEGGRGLTAQVFSDRALTSRATLSRIEKGDYRVSIGVYASVLHALGMIESVADLADARYDEVGLRLTNPAAKRRSKKGAPEALWQIG